ncbi:hypothetical protein AB0H18_41110 [Streptomyces sp. NPDC020766]|uniref:hypothetical protein n=1 Tax=Streptomyces sp. NPDC020766 TaxID=3155011 RepID=UPI0033E97D81
MAGIEQVLRSQLMLRLCALLAFGLFMGLLGMHGLGPMPAAASMSPSAMSADHGPTAVGAGQTRALRARVLPQETCIPSVAAMSSISSRLITDSLSPIAGADGRPIPIDARRLHAEAAASGREPVPEAVTSGLSMGKVKPCEEVPFDSSL